MRPTNIIDRVEQLGLDELDDNAGDPIYMRSRTDIDALYDAMHRLRENHFGLDGTTLWVMHPSIADELVDESQVIGFDDTRHRFAGFDVLRADTIEEDTAYLLDRTALGETPFEVAQPFVVRNPDAVVKLAVHPHAELFARLEEMERETEELRVEVTELREELADLTG